MSFKDDLPAIVLCTAQRDWNEVVRISRAQLAHPLPPDEEAFCHVTLGGALLKLGEPAPAIEHLRKGLSLGAATPLLLTPDLVAIARIDLWAACGLLHDSEFGKPNTLSICLGLSLARAALAAIAASGKIWDADQRAAVAGFVHWAETNNALRNVDRLVEGTQDIETGHFMIEGILRRDFRLPVDDDSSRRQQVAILGYLRRYLDRFGARLEDLHRGDDWRRAVQFILECELGTDSTDGKPFAEYFGITAQRPSKAAASSGCVGVLVMVGLGLAVLGVALPSVRSAGAGRGRPERAAFHREVMPAASWISLRSGRSTER